MARKKLRYAFNYVIKTAQLLTCENLKHKKSEEHDVGYICPVEYEINRCCEIIKQYMKDNNI